MIFLERFRGEREDGGNETEECRRAIELYFEGIQEFQKKEIDEKDKKIFSERAAADADHLVKEGDEGLRLGAPEWAHAKLKFSVFSGNEGKFFWVYDNGMDEEKFREWEKFIGGKFEANGLRFKYFAQKEFKKF